MMSSPSHVAEIQRAQAQRDAAAKLAEYQRETDEVRRMYLWSEYLALVTRARKEAA